MDRKSHQLGILVISLFAGACCLRAEENVEEIEARHTAAIQSFETETRSELTRIARSKSLSGEEKILRTEEWFATHAQRIAEINAMADTLDELRFSKFRFSKFPIFKIPGFSNFPDFQISRIFKFPGFSNFPEK